MNTVFVKKCVLMLLLGVVMAHSLLYAADGKLQGSRVLVYIKNGNGYVHDNRAAAVACIRQLGRENGFGVDVADTSLVFTEVSLKKYNLLIFASTNNEVFANDAQRLAFRRYIEAGGGFVGIHSVTGTERNWTWFKQLVGETFTWHPRFQKYTVRMTDAKHPSMQNVPAVWEREDECYFGKEMYPGIKVLMMHDLTTLDRKDKSQDSLVVKNAGSYKDYFPAVWYQSFQGGNVWVTTLGHAKEAYSDPVFRHHLLQGIAFVAKEYKGLNYSRARATAKDDPLF